MFGKIPSRWIFVQESEKPKPMHFAAGDLLKKPAAPANSNQTIDFLQQFFGYDDMCSARDHTGTTASVTYGAHKVNRANADTADTADGPVPALH